MMRDMAHQLSDSKQFALDVLDVFDELAQPELKTAMMKGLWNGSTILERLFPKFNGIKKWIAQTILRK